MWDSEVDLLVAGSGMAGLSAALVASVEGLQVLLCEKEAKVGGTTATSGGVIWIVGSSEARAAGATDSDDEARRYLRHELGDHFREELVEAFLASGKTAVDYLRQHSEVVFDHFRYPDYHSDAPGGSKPGNRVLVARPYDGRLLGQAFERVQPPMPAMLVFGGMMFNRADVPLLMRPYASWKGFKLAMKMALRHLSDRLRYSRGTRIFNGNALVARFLFSLLKRNVSVRTNAPLVDLVTEQGRVVGAVIEHEGLTQRIRTRRGVVLATGGAARNAALLRELAPDFPHDYTLASRGSTGDGILLARKVGAVTDTQVASPAVWCPASLMPEANGSVTVLPYGFLDRGKPGVIAVNCKGKRFVNEANSYQDIVFAMYARRSEDHLKAYLICDRDFIRDYGLGFVPPHALSLKKFVRSGYLKSALSLESLAVSIGVDFGQLQRTVDEHNGYASTGVDLAFGKGDTAFNRANGDASNKPNPCLRPIRQAPFFALGMHPATFGMSVGLKTDGNSRVLDANDRPVPGLWACGGDTTSVMRGYCPAGGVTLGPALVFGYRAGMDAASAHNTPAGPS